MARKAVQQIEELEERGGEAREDLEEVFWFIEFSTLARALEFARHQMSERGYCGDEDLERVHSILCLASERARTLERLAEQTGAGAAVRSKDGVFVREINYEDI